MNENSPICARATETDDGGLERVSHQPDDRERRQRLADQNDGQRCSDHGRRRQQHAWIEQHADGHKEQNRKCISHRECVGGSPDAEFRSPDHQAGEECAERHRDAEDFRGRHRNPERDRQNGKRKEFPRLHPRDVRQQPGQGSAAHDDREDGQRRHLDNSEGDGRHGRVRCRLTRHRRHEHEDQNGEQVLHDQPADRDMPGRRVQLTMVRQHAHQDDGAGDRQRNAEYEACHETPPGCICHSGAQCRGDETLDDRARNSDAAHREQILDMKLQANAEHQQDDADLRELFRQRAIGDEPWRVWTHENAGDEVTDDGRESQPLRDVAANEGGDQTSGQGEDQVEFVHALPGTRTVAAHRVPFNVRSRIRDRLHLAAREERRLIVVMR